MGVVRPPAARDAAPRRLARGLRVQHRPERLRQEPAVGRRRAARRGDAPGRPRARPGRGQHGHPHQRARRRVGGGRARAGGPAALLAAAGPHRWK